MESYALLIAATLSAGTVLAIAALGLLINEKAGIVNLGAEGMMLCAAIAGFATVVHTGSDLLGFAAGMGAGALLALIFGALVIGLNTNQYATGLALSLFGVGFSAFVGTGYVQAKLPERMRFEVPGLVDLPFVGPALFKQHPMVYLVILFTIALIWFLERSRAGLVLRAGLFGAQHPLGGGGHWRRFVRLGGRLYIHHLHPAVGGGDDRGQGLDRLGPDHLRHLATHAGVDGGVFVRWCHHAAVSFPSQWGGGAQPVPEHAALPGHHHRAGADIPQSTMDSGQHARFFGQTVLPRHMMKNFAPSLGKALSGAIITRFPTSSALL